MKILMRIIFFSAIVLISSCHASEKREKFDCVYSSGDLCVIPFERLLSDRRYFDERLISFSGVISVEGSEVYLYPDIDSKLHGIREKSVLIRADSKFLNDVGQLDGKYCGVTGRVRFENGNHWTTLNLTNDIQQLPAIIDTFSPAPPKPE